MKKKELFQLYEKLYFHEIDMREHLSSRLQIPLAIIVVLIGFLGYMLKNLFYDSLTTQFYFFIVLYGLSTTFTALAIYFLIRSWFGYEYSFLPSAKKTEEYRTELFDTYKNCKDTEKLVNKYMSKYLYDYFIDCSSINTVNNDNRSLNLHYARICIITATVLAFIAFLPFRFAKIDKSSKSMPLKVHIVQPDNFKESTMSHPDSKPSSPPKPPSPPPKRVIKEGVKIKKPK